MTMSKMWMVIAVGGIFALCYVGHGLHQGRVINSKDDILPSAAASNAANYVQGKSFSWQAIKSQGSPTTTYRAKVPGGWLVRVRERFSGRLGGGMGVGVTFMPDPQHKWDGASLP